EVADPGRRQPGHGRTVGERPRALALRPLQRRGLRDQRADGPADQAHPGRAGAPRALRLASARPLLDRAYRHPALSARSSFQYRRAVARLLARATKTAEAMMDLGRLLLRGVVGPLFVGHGTQKLFGWFGGHGLDGTAGFFENLGLRPGQR